MCVCRLLEFYHRGDAFRTIVPFLLPTNVSIVHPSSVRRNLIASTPIVFAWPWDCPYPYPRTQTLLSRVHVDLLDWVRRSEASNSRHSPGPSLAKSSSSLDPVCKAFYLFRPSSTVFDRLLFDDRPYPRPFNRFASRLQASWWNISSCLRHIPFRVSRSVRFDRAQPHSSSNPIQWQYHRRRSTNPAT